MDFSCNQLLHILLRGGSNLSYLRLDECLRRPPYTSPLAHDVTRCSSPPLKHHAQVLLSLAAAAVAAAATTVVMGFPV